MLIVSLLNTGCIQATPSCDSGFVMGSDGLCYQEAQKPAPKPPTAEIDPPASEATTVPDPPYDDMFWELWGECHPAEVFDGNVDLASGCIGQLCRGMTYEDAVDLYGEPLAPCEVYDEGDILDMSCDFVSGATATFEPSDPYVKSPEDVATWFLERFSVWSIEVGATKSGLGIGASYSCFAEELGDPFFVFLIQDPPEYATYYAMWDTVVVYDFNYDGLADHLVF